MNIYTNSNYDLMTKRKKREEYRTILDNQIRQKQKIKHDKQRFQTEPEYGRPYYSPRYLSIPNNSDQTPKTKKFNHQSNYLPAIDQSSNKRRENFGSHHRRSHSFGNDSYGYQDTDIQTMEALTQCEAIIENLRKLRLKSLSSMKRKQKQLAYQISTPHKYGLNQNHFKTKESSAEQEVMMFRAWQPNPSNKNKQKGKKTEDKSVSKKLQKKLQLDTNFDQSAQLEQFQQDINNLPKSLRKKYEAQQKNPIEGDQDGMKNENQTKNLNEDEDQNQEQELKKGRKRKFLLKYLAKAKFRGSKLHQKILEYKNKTVSIQTQVKNERIDEENLSQNNENQFDKESLNQKEEEKQQQQLRYKNSEED